MTVNRMVAIAVLGASGAMAQNPSAADLQKQYVGQQWVVKYPLVPCTRQVAEITALEVFDQKVHPTKAPKAESVAIHPPGQGVRFTLRCPDGNSYTREIGLKYFQSEFEKPPSQ